MTLKKHIWPLHYNHNLAAGKLRTIDSKCTIIMSLMWDIVTEIKSNIFGWVWLLKNLFFLEYLYFSESDIRVLLFVFWLRNRPSIKYVRNCAGAYRGRGVEKSVIRYVRTKWMAPKKCCGVFFVYWFGQVHWSITTSKKNAVVFFHHYCDYFILCDN